MSRFVDKNGNPVEMVTVTKVVENGQEREVMIPRKQKEWGDRFQKATEDLIALDKITDPVVAKVENDRLQKEFDDLKKEAADDETNAHPSAVALRSAQPLRNTPPPPIGIKPKTDLSGRGDAAVLEAVRKTLGVKEGEKHPTDEMNRAQLEEVVGTLEARGDDVAGNLPPLVQGESEPAVPSVPATPESPVIEVIEVPTGGKKNGK